MLIKHYLMTYDYLSVFVYLFLPLLKSIQVIISRYDRCISSRPRSQDGTAPVAHTIVQPRANVLLETAMKGNPQSFRKIFT
jgi:hypothetical protein